MRPTLTTRADFALACLSGALYFLAFPPIDAGTFAFIALVPLLLALRGQTRLRAFLLGWTAGTLAIYALVASSILEAASRFMPEHRWAAWALALVIPQVYGALYFGLFALWAREIQTRRRAPVFELLAISAAWTACELVRSRLGDGCPWLLLAHSQHLRLWMLQIADLGGAPAVSFVVALINVALAMQIAGAVSLPGRCRLQVIGTALAVLAAVLGYGEWQLRHWSEPSAEGFRVALVQGNVPDEWRYSLGRLPETMRRLRDLTRQTTSFAPDLVIWPENAVSVSVADNDRLFSGLAGQLRPGARLLVGAPRAERGGNSRTLLHNSAYLLNASGSPVEVYDKLRLTPFGEALPVMIRELMGDASSAEGSYSPGKRFTLFDVAGHRFATVICYEAIYAEIVRPFVRAGAEFLVNISNDGWFGAQPSLEQHFDAVLLRAVESRRFLLRATNAGITAVIDPRGAIIAEAPRAQTSVLAATIHPSQAQTIYTRVGDTFGWLCLIAAGIFVAAARP